MILLLRFSFPKELYPQNLKIGYWKSSYICAKKKRKDLPNDEELFLIPSSSCDDSSSISKKMISSSFDYILQLISLYSSSSSLTGKEENFPIWYGLLGHNMDFKLWSSWEWMCHDSIQAVRFTIRIRSLNHGTRIIAL